jgi:hypothetical protein
MAYSVVRDLPFRVKRRVPIPTVDGNSVIQELGYLERQAYRFYWIRTSELQLEIEALEDLAGEGWIIAGEPSRTPIVEPLDLYNVSVTLERMVDK